MPCHHDSGRFWSINPKRWGRCLDAASTQMVAQGWNPKARKFADVQRHRARRYWCDRGFA